MRVAPPWRLQSTAYSSDWFAARQRATRQSAEVVLPLIFEVVKPNSVVDVGCGLGSWLAVARELGVDDVLGIDGDYINRADLEIPRHTFVVADLLRPLRLAKSFDLALSLEVGEHLPCEAAPHFVSTLVGFANVVVFSAAAPLQGGTHHLNEQWPDYWARLFLENEYIPVDWLRPRIWNDERVRYFYAQNTIIYVSKDELPQLREFAVVAERAASQLPLALVHPRLYANALNRFPPPSIRAIAGLPRFVAKCVVAPLTARSRTRPWHRDEGHA